ncbi:hypothetical protein ACGFMK_34950 [Amycolatopsis sp. NPDC049252]|uniref:hypothetical protein n=1 Tax=Amycolatopsis sp. NPDC049252 TaxID=3363933 RepID=UPI0037203ED8
MSGWDLTSEQTALAAVLGVATGAQETSHSSASRHEVVAALREVSPLVLVIDEADKALLAQWGAGFFGFLRWLDDSHLRQGIGILLVGGPVLTSFRDPDDKGSPPLNTAESHFIDPLDREAVEKLAARRARHRHRHADGTVRRPCLADDTDAGRAVCGDVVLGRAGRRLRHGVEDVPGVGTAAR